MENVNRTKIDLFIQVYLKKLRLMKVVLLGDGGVGKTSFLQKLQTNIFDPKYRSTVGFENKVILVEGIEFNVYDMAGQEKYSKCNDELYTGTNSFMIFYDLSSILSFKNVSHWLQKAKHLAPDAQILLVGSKADVKPTKVSDNKIKNFATTHRIWLTTKISNKYSHLEMPFRMLLNQIT